jgi:hypothetical protein
MFTGRAYGDGIYTSNVFDKSLAYCDSYNQGSTYILVQRDRDVQIKEIQFKGAAIYVHRFVGAK